jgi:phosphoribosylformylglycinamidine synthase
MIPPTAIIVRAPGTNCDLETQYAFERAGAHAPRIHVNELIARPAVAEQAQILCIPGGFSYGDDIAAGRILARQLQHHLADMLQRFKHGGKLILGICNGFQVLMQTGLLMPAAGAEAQATLTWNDSGQFEDRWVDLEIKGDRCVVLRNLSRLYLPIAHAEGKFVARKASVLDALGDAGQLVLRYALPPGASANGDVPYPFNPNGSQANVAGICDATGRVFGLMPHPERFIDRTHHPRWTRESLPDQGDGLGVFRNAVEYFA